MRKTKIVLYLSLGIIILFLIGYLDGLRPSLVTINNELDQKEHFGHSEIIDTEIIDDAATIIVRNDTWIQCRIMDRKYGFLWKARNEQYLPFNTQGSLLPMSLESFATTYKEACQGAKDSIEPSAIFTEVAKLLNPYLGNEGKIRFHKINLMKIESDKAHIVAMVQFETPEYSVSSHYEINFKYANGWVHTYSDLYVDTLAVTSPVTVDEFWSWYQSTHIEDMDLIMRQFKKTSSIMTQSIHLEKGEMVFTVVTTSETSIWTGVQTQKVLAKYDLDRGWTFQIMEDTLVETLDWSGIWKVDLYEPVNDGPSIYISTIHNIDIRGGISFSTTNSGLSILSNTMKIRFRLNGKTYEKSPLFHMDDKLAKEFYIELSDNKLSRLFFELRFVEYNELKEYKTELYIHNDSVWGTPRKIN